MWEQKPQSRSSDIEPFLTYSGCLVYCNMCFKFTRWESKLCCFHVKINLICFSCLSCNSSFFLITGMYPHSAGADDQFFMFFFKVMWYNGIFFSCNRKPSICWSRWPMTLWTMFVKVHWSPQPWFLYNKMKTPALR